MGKAARRKKDARFTALLHHITPELLERSYYELKRKASPGVDGVTWQAYGVGLRDRVVDLHDRVHGGTYRALDALWMGLSRRKVNWVLDADVHGFFDAIDHEWMLKFVEHRIADRRVLRLIRKWLRAGVSEDGEWSRTTAVGSSNS